MRSQLISLVFRIRVVGLLLAGGSLWVFAQIADEVLEKESYALDTRILLAIQRIHNPWLDRVMVVTTFLGDPIVLFVICLVIGIWLYKQHHSQAITLGIAAIGAVLLNYLLKQLFTRARPALWERIINVRNYSFPSGHAMVSLVIYGVIGYILTNYFPQHRKLITSLTVVLVILIGFSRMYLGVHWPTDVAAGYAAGLVWLIACILSLRVWRQRRARRYAQAAKDSVSSHR